MNAEQFKNETNYRLSAHIIAGMLKAGILTKGELSKVDTKLTKIYQPILSSLTS